ETDALRPVRVDPGDTQAIRREHRPLAVRDVESAQAGVATDLEPRSGRQRARHLQARVRAPADLGAKAEVGMEPGDPRILDGEGDVRTQRLGAHAALDIERSAPGQ